MDEFATLGEHRHGLDYWVSVWTADFIDRSLHCQTTQCMKAWTRYSRAFAGAPECFTDAHVAVDKPGDMAPHLLDLPADAR